MGPFFRAQSLAVTLQNISVLLRAPRPNLPPPSHTYNIAFPPEESNNDDMTINPLELVSTQLPLEQLQPLDNVSLWLSECGLNDYIHTFKTAGYDDINLIKILNDEDLDAMGIDKPGTRKKILFTQRSSVSLPLLSLPLWWSGPRLLLLPAPKETVERTPTVAPSAASTRSAVWTERPTSATPI